MYDRAVSRRVAYLLLVAAASVRLLIQAAAMPPYAGLDELYHVARLAFVLEEHRNPTTALRYYTHVIPETERAAADRLADRLLGRDPDPRISRD